MKLRHRPVVLVLGVLVLLAILLWPARQDRGTSTSPARPPAVAAKAEPPAQTPNPALLKQAERALSRAKTPIAMVPAGTQGPARFALRDRGVTAFFTPRGLALSILGRPNGQRPGSAAPGFGLHWGLVGAQEVEPRPEAEQETRVNVLKGERENWQIDQKTYGRVVYDNVKPGVHMTVETAVHGVKYTLTAGKASDIDSLRLRYQGAAALRAAEDGKSLSIGTGTGQIREDGLIVTQQGRPIEASYRVTGQDEYAIVLHGADPEKPVEVDPVIGWSTYVGGTLAQGEGSDYGYSVKVDLAGFMYVAGTTYSGDFPATTGDTSIGGYSDGFIMKIGPGGTVTWATLLGGFGNDEIQSLAIDGASPPNVYLTGYTESQNFPLVGAAVDSSYDAGEAFVAKINNGGTALVWSTFLGGASQEYGRAISVDSAGTSVWVAGYTYSADFPTFGGFDSTPATMPDGFVSKLSVAGASTLSFAYSSFVGGSDTDIVNGMVVDGTGAAYLTGYTYSSDLPLAGTPYRNFNSGSTDVFVVKVKPTATALEWGTYIGGTGTDVANGIAVDGFGNSYVTGYTYSTNYPTLAVPSGLLNNAGSADAFLTKLNSAGSALIYSGYLGGADYEIGQAVAVDATGSGIVTGVTYSTQSMLPAFPIGGAPTPYDSTQNGGADIFVTSWQPTPSGGTYFLKSSTFIGGAGYDSAYGIAIDTVNSVLYLTGETSSTPTGGPGSFPGAPGGNPVPFDNTLGGGTDAFILRMSITSGGLTFGSYVGGTNAVGDDYGKEVAIDAVGNVYVAGSTYSSNFPVLGPYQGAPVVTVDLAVQKYTGADIPALVWSTYLGGSDYEDVTGIALDPTTPGQVCLTGYTYSTNFPRTIGLAPVNMPEIFVTKLVPAGNNLTWSRMVGGNSTDVAHGLAVNSSGQIVVSGYTNSTNYPISAIAYQPVAATLPDAVLTLVSADGLTLPWSTHLGGNNYDYAQAVAFNSAGTEVYVGGYSASTNLPATAGAFQTAMTPGGSPDLWAARFNPSAATAAAQLQMLTYYGGTGYDYLTDIAVDTGGNLYIVSQVESSAFPTSIGPPYGGSADVGIVKLNAAGARQWARFLGGSNSDYPMQIRVDAAGSAYVTGYTYSINFPVQGAFQPNLAGNSDAFITKLDVTGASLDWSSYLGGSDYEVAYGLALGTGAKVLLVGYTYSRDFPLLNPQDNSLDGNEFFIARIDNSNPSVPTSLAQFKANGTTALTPVGAWSSESTFIVKATLGDLDDDTVALQVQIQPIDVAFTANGVSATGTLAAGGAGHQVSVTFPGGTQEFHWQARTIDVNNRTSAWVVFGGNSDGAPPGILAARDVGRDTSFPTITLTTPASVPHTTATSPISLVGTFGDTGGSGVSSVSWFNLSAPPIPPPANSGSATLNSPGAGQWTIPSISLVPGVNNINLSVTDAAGNTTFITGNPIAITWDTTAPVTTISSPNVSPYLTGTGSGGVATGSITVTGTSTDNFMVSNVTWANSTGGSGFASLGVGTTSRTWSASIPLTPTQTNVITITTRDAANNPHAVQTSVLYDNTPPSVNITTPGGTTTTSAATIQLVGSASDVTLTNTISSVTWTSSNGGFGNATLNSPGPGQWTIPSVGLSDGSNVITVKANDGVVNFPSNLNSATTSITIYKDISDPTVTIVDPAPAGAPPGFTTGNGSITVSGTVVDDLNVASLTWINPSAGINTPQPVAIVGPPTSKTWSANVSLTAGANFITFTASDGTTPPRTHSASTYITLSATAPALVVTNPPGATGVTAVTPFPMAGTATPESPKTISGVTVRNLTTNVFATVVGTTSWSANVDLVIGTNSIEIIATDNAAPIPLTTTVNRTLILDPTAPTVTITGPTGAATFASPANSVVLSGVSADNRSVASVKWRFFGQAPALGVSTTLVGPPGSVTWTSASIPLSPGDNSLIVRSTDDAGNFSEDTITVTYDTATPGITITSPTSASSTTTLLGTVALGGNANDDVQLQSVTWINAATGVSGPAIAPLAAWTTPAISLNPGANVITVIAIDAAGNSQTDTITVFYDGALPSIVISSPTSAPELYTASGVVSLGGTASDDVQVAQVTWTRSGAASPNSGLASGTTTWSIASIPLNLGANTITVTATDGAIQSSNMVITVYYDPTPPTVQIDTPATDPFNTTTTPVILDGIAGDNLGVTEVSWANLTTGGSGLASGLVSWSCAAPLTSGSNLIQVTSKDAAGNATTASITVVYDPAAPLIAITSPTTGISIATNSTPIVIGGTAQDDVGVAKVEWTRSGALLPNTGFTLVNTNPWSFSVDLVPGENVFTVVATDGVGRTGTAFLTIVFDPTPPQVTVLIPTTDASYNTTQASINLSGVANDNVSLQSVTWSNAATGGGIAPTQGVGAWSISSAPLIEGSNLFTITATDSVNNIGTKQLNVVYDGTNPLIDIVLPDNSATVVTTTRPLPISGTASDNLGLAGVTWANNRGGGGAAVVTGPTWNASIYLFTGINVITVTATDGHGRTATDVLTVDFTPEGTAPSVDITSPAGPTAVSATQVVALAGVATDNVGVVTVTWRNQTTGIGGTVVPGAPADFSTWTTNVPLTSGPNVIVVTAVDDAGNLATDSVTVTYTPATADTTDPILTIDQPVNTDLYTAVSSPLDITVLATDNDGVAAVTWTNSGTGGAGTATPSATVPEWTLRVGLALGTNLIKVTAVDPSGNTSSDTLIVTFTPAAPDGIPPSITIVSPPSATTFNTAVGTVTVTGTSLDGTAVAEVVWINGASLVTGSAIGTLAWTADVPLVPGINVLTFRVYDTSGNTLDSQLTVLYTPPPPPPEDVPAGSCGLLGLDAWALLLGLAAWRRRRSTSR
ncbi:MAG TPA: SBBP repeat-containing protein [Planctomycetota bacterium]